MSRRRRAKRRADLLGALLIGLALAGLGGLAAAGIALRPPPVDEETLCRADAPLAAHTIILVDSTDRLEPRHRRRLRAIADQERARLGAYERLTILRLRADRPQEPAIVFSKCLPRPPETANPLFENASHVRRTWDESFADALSAAVRRASQSRAADASPLLAGLRAIAAEPDFSDAVRRRRLVLASDLLEHQPDGFSLYARGADYARWRAADARGPADLTGVDVRVAMLDRPDLAALQTAAVTQFWEHYLDATGARAISFDPAP